jgi:hypothetical protein
MKKHKNWTAIVAVALVTLCVPAAEAQNPNNDPSLAAAQLLNADDHTLIMIDHEGP